jgi:hypothetical protein
MKHSNFAAFLNRFGHVRAKYGGVLVKKAEQNGELRLHVMQWRNMITDQVDILLKLLGKTGLKTKKQYEDAVFDLTGYELGKDDINQINETLAAIIEKAEAAK